MRQFSSVLLLLITFTGLWSNEGLAQAPRAETRQEPVNLLQNPGFEGDYYPWFGINEVRVAHGWTPWWRSRTDADPPAHYFSPEYKQASVYTFANRVHSGAAAQQWFTFHSSHEAGMYQQVFGVTPGTRYRFTIWAHAWSSSQDDPNVSVEPAYPHMRVGIDPTGNWNAWAGTVIWSGYHHYIDTWGQLTVEAVAQSDVITVFMYSNPNWPVKHNDMYWDDAALVAVGEGDVPVPPTATTVAPPPPPATTNTPAAPPPPTPTCAPAPSDWVNYSVQRGDTLYRLATSRGTTVERVVSVNCLSSTTIHVGQALLLPPLPATATATPAGPTATPAPSPTRTPAPTPTRTPTSAPTQTAVATSAPSTATATKTEVAPTATKTEVPVAQVTATSAAATLAPPPTFTPGAPPPAPTAKPSGGSGRPCGTIAVSAGIVLVAGFVRQGFQRSPKVSDRGE